MILCTNVRSRVCVHTTCTCVQLHMHLHVSYVQSLQKKKECENAGKPEFREKKESGEREGKGHTTKNFVVGSALEEVR